MKKAKMYRFRRCNICGGTGWLTDPSEERHIICPACDSAGCVLRPVPDSLAEVMKKAMKNGKIK